VKKISINSVSSITSAIETLENELCGLLNYPSEELASIIKDVGFCCTLCGKCCTKEFNSHVFLLRDDLKRAKEKYPDMIAPAPYFEVCDNNGCFYVSGYALKIKENGDCVFLEDKKCRIYDDRFLICRIYPYMLHRESDERGKTDWRQISGLNEHGEYNTKIPDEICKESAEDTKYYEKEFLEQQRDFYLCLLKHFKENNLRPVRKLYDENMKRFQKGENIKIFTFNGESFDESIISKDDRIIISINPK